MTGFRAEGRSERELLELPVDILVPAALENQITARERGRIQAKMIAEGRTARRRRRRMRSSHERGVFVIPDILCNAGGVTVSYFEWVQSLTRDHWTESIVNEKLKVIMVKAFGETLAIAKRESCDMRTAAYLLAVERVADAMEMRGLYP